MTAASVKEVYTAREQIRSGGLDTCTSQPVRPKGGQVVLRFTASCLSSFREALPWGSHSSAPRDARSLSCGQVPIPCSSLQLRNGTGTANLERWTPIPPKPPGATRQTYPKSGVRKFLFPLIEKLASFKMMTNYSLKISNELQNWHPPMTRCTEIPG